MNRAVVVTLSAAAVIAAGTGVWFFKPGWIGMAPGQAAQGKAAPGKPTGGAQPRGGQAVAVEVAPVVRKAMPQLIDAVGTVQPIASIAIKARLDSQVVQVHVAEGSRVTEGDLLFTLDSRQLRAQREQITAQIAKDMAQIEQARRDLARAEDLSGKGVTSTVQRDTAATALKALEAQLAFDRAALSSVEAQLTYTEIRAPVSGRIGSIAAKPGAVVRMADTQSLAVVNQMDPIYIAFSVPAPALVEVRAVIERGAVRVEAGTGPNMSVGEIAFIENTMDLATGTVTAKARMTNAAERLWPGAFVPARIVLGVDANAVTMPASALQIGQAGPFVFVVREGRAVVVPIKVARTIGEEVVVASGLNGGEQVVTSGQLRLADGVPVSISAPRPPGAGKPAAGKPPAEAKN
ncbi:MAG: efflux RND transporter periplasmic adaptor subunit [Alphaproteobacteria bacterium]|nr:efflux RND transporter periplasmic adaptor subunit [Alphaproteobacteria bacterium]